MPASCSSSSSLVVDLKMTKICNLGVNFPVNLYIELFKLLLILIDLTVMLIICVLKVSGSTCSSCLGFMLKCSCRKGGERLAPYLQVLHFPDLLVEHVCSDMAAN